MNALKFESIAKLGISLTTIITIILYFIGKAYYVGFFMRHGVPIAIASVEFRDLLAINTGSLMAIYQFATGYVFAMEAKGFDQGLNNILHRTDVPVQVQSSPLQGAVNRDGRLLAEAPDGKTATFTKTETIAVGLVALVSVAGLTYQTYYGEFLKLSLCVVANFWGVAVYFLLKTRSWFLRVLLLWLTLGGFLFHAVIVGSIAAETQNTIVSVTQLDGTTLTDARLVYNSSSAIVVILGDSGRAVRIPASQIRVITTPVSRNWEEPEDVEQ